MTGRTNKSNIKKIILFLVVMTFVFHHATVVEADIKPVSITKVEKKIVHKNVTYGVNKNFTKATGEVAEQIKRASDETGVPYEHIEKVAWCESRYNPMAMHENNNGSIDKGIFQINSIHRKRGIKMGLSFYEIEDNTTFAIYLINRKIANGRPPLEDWVCKP